MKTNLILSVVTVICFLTSCKKDTKTVTVEDSPTIYNENQHLDNEMMKTMDDVMTKANAISKIGNFDMNFANMMILHHQGAIDMALIEVEKGTDEKIKMMAQNIITKQTAEQVKLKEILEKSKAKQTKSKEIHPELHNAMKTMIDKMEETKMTGNTDKDFAMMMILHHECAIEMSRSLPFHSKNSQLQQLSQKGIKDQTKVTEEFKIWLSANK